jgi:trk system potassium uptake protein
VNTRARGRYAPLLVAVTCVGLCLVLALFTVAALARGEAWRGFLVAATLAGLLGGALLAVGRSGREPSRREALMAVLAVWGVVPLIGAIPFTIGGPLAPLDALFESASGFTTTGATMLTDFSVVSHTLFMWRALTQWIGGIGIIVLFIATFPQLAIAGRQLFATEAPGPETDRFLPRLRSTAMAILLVYGLLTVACAFAYRLAGMSPFDAVANALTTLSAGGFSPAARSFESYAPALSWVAISFMLFAGANFALVYRAFTGRPWALWNDPEFRTYLAVLLVGALALSGLLATQYGWGEALRHGTFQALSITTSTGYASADFAEWPTATHGLLVVLMLIGGSAGSAAGGVKVVRWLILTRVATREVRHTMHPRAVLPVRLGARIVPADVVRAVSAFIMLYVALLVTTAVGLVLLGSDEVTALTATLATLGNIGPGFASVGPMASYADLHPLAKAWLTFAMIAGRLEVVTVFVIFTRAWWRRPSRHARR